MPNPHRVEGKITVRSFFAHLWRQQWFHWFLVLVTLAFMTWVFVRFANKHELQEPPVYQCKDLIPCDRSRP